MLCVCFGELATRFDQFDKYINISLLSASFEQSFLYIYMCIGAIDWMRFYKNFDLVLVGFFFSSLAICESQ